MWDSVFGLICFCCAFFLDTVLALQGNWESEPTLRWRAYINNREFMTFYYYIPRSVKSKNILLYILTRYKLKLTELHAFLNK